MYLTKSFAELKSFMADGPGGFEGYGSLADVEDSVGDVVDHNAFTDSLESFKRDGFIAAGHDWQGLSIGTIADVYEDDRGLFVRAEFHSTPAAQAARQVATERMERGKSVGLSIGFKINDGGFEMKDGIRHLKSLKLYEISMVSVPALRPAGLTSVKGFGITFDDHSDHVRVALEEWLERAKSGLDVRLKEGRAISTMRRDRMATMQGCLQDHANEIAALLTETAPPQKAGPTPEEIQALFTDFALTEARLSGVAIPF